MRSLTLASACCSYDFGVRLYDFAGMKRDLRPFRELEPVRPLTHLSSISACAHTSFFPLQCGSHQIRAVSWSPSGDAFLVVAGSAEPKVLDRDGRELGYFTRGDMYIRDLKHTRGHIMGCTSGAWHPRDKSVVLTASEDGTLRLWDIEHISKDGGAAGGKCQTAVVKGGTVLAVEGFEGTDKALARGGELAGKSGGAVAVKVAKEQHDLRFDIPCVGPRTLEVCAASGIRVLAFEVGRTLLLEQEVMENLVRQHGLSLLTVEREK